MIQQKAYKFRVYPNQTQCQLLNKTFGGVRFAWNSWVENFNKDEDVEKQFRTSKEFRQSLSWMKEISAAAVQQKERDFKEFKSQFFNPKRKKKLGRPSFKSRKQRQSYRLPNQKFSVSTTKIRLEKVGWIKTVFDRTIPDTVEFVNITVSKDKIGDYFVSVLVKEEIKPKLRTGKEVGVDVGLKEFAILSTGEKVENPRFFRENQSEIRKIQKHLSRKKKGSNQYHRTKTVLAKTHRKVERRRSWFLHNLSTHLVNDYDVIAIEDLNVAGMLKNHCLAKSIADASWSELFKQLEYKTKWYGKELRKVNRFEPTSKKCSVCGYYYKDLTLDIRVWTCPRCGTVHDRDVNAATNTLNESVGVDAELQTWRERKTSTALCVDAVPCEASRMDWELFSMKFTTIFICSHSR